MASKSVLLRLNQLVIPAIIVLSVASFYLQNQIEARYREEIGKSLDTVLDTTAQSLMTWNTKERSATLTWANTPQLRSIAKKLADQYAGEESFDLVHGDAQKTLRKWLLPVIQGKGYRGYFIIGPGDINLASSRNGNIGEVNLLAERGDFLERLRQGETVLSMPIKSDVVLKDALGTPLREQNSMFVGAPIIGGKNEIVALLTFRLDPAQDYYPILARGRIGQSGESYTLSQDGTLLSQSRFRDQLVDLGLLDNSQLATLNLKIVDPGVNLLDKPDAGVPMDQRPRTKMAKGIYNQNQGHDWIGYRDYRGVEVIGSWQWVDGLGYGITSEIDVDEAFSVLLLTKKVITLFTVAVSLLLLGLMVLFNKGQRDLVKSETQIRTLIDNLPSFVYVKSLSGGLSLANKAILSLKRNHNVPDNASTTIAFSSDIADFMNEKDGDVVENQCPIEFKQPLEIDYEKRTYLTTKFPLLDEGGVIFGIGAIHTNITDLVSTQDQLAEQELYLRAVLDNAAEGIITADPRGVILSFNKHAEKLFGYRPDEVIGCNLSILMPKDIARQHDRYLRAHKEIGTTNVIGQGREVKGLRKDGTNFPALLSISEVFTGNGCIYTGIIHDLSDLYEATDSLEKLNQDLERRVAERTKEADFANLAKGEFLANMSHEIRTPLNAVVGLSHLMGKTDLSVKQLDYLQKIEGASRSLLGIINDILDFSKIEAGKLDIEVVDFCFDDVLSDLRSLVANKISDKNVELLFDVDNELPSHAMGDPLRLGQVLLNLANNAAKFTDNGEVVLAVCVVSETDKEIEVNFAIKDSGIGMTTEQQAKLFTAFTQADSSISRTHGGTGLGLTICKQLIELMGGDISLSSEQGKGSVFSFSLAFLRSSKTESLPDIVDAIKNIRVLVVDDNEISLDVIGRMLSEYTPYVTTASTAEKAIEILEAGGQCDLVLMDFSMPGMNGIQAAENIKRSVQISKIPVILMMSSFDESHIVDDQHSSMLDGFLSKPVLSSTLMRAIYNQLDKGSIRSTYSVTSNTSTGANYNLESTILIVEDNDLNQQIARELLEDKGVTVAVADNGAVAIEMLEVAHYDLVLMDIQMPVMDGYTATQKIRENVRFKDLPIIAMTANAMKVDVERCHDVGMNDYIAKPIDPEKVFTTIEKWLAKATVVKPTQLDIGVSNRIRAADTDDNLRIAFELEGFDTTQGVQRVGNKWHRYRELLTLFVENYSDAIKNVRELVNQKQYHEAIRCVHTLRGIVGNVSAEALYDVLCELDVCLQNGDLASLPGLIDKSDILLAQAVTRIEGLSQEKC